MEFKASLKDRLKRTRSSIFSFSQPITLFAVKPNAYSNPNARQKQQSTPITEPPCIDKTVENELRYACFRLRRSIERGASLDDQDQRPEEVGERYTNTAPQPPSLPATLKSQRNRYHSGPEFEVRPGGLEKDNISQLYERTARIARAESPNATDAAHANANGEQPYSSGETLVGEDDAAYPEVPLDLIRDLNSMPHLAPSLARPPAAPAPSRLARKKRVENLQDASQGSQSSQSSTEVESETEPSHKPTDARPRYRYSWLPRTATRPTSAIETGAPPPVFIDIHGKPQIMTPEEERQRQRHLQQAVREKMVTGKIRPRPVSDTHHARACMDCSQAPQEGDSQAPQEGELASGAVKDTGEQLSRRRSILRKLSSFSFAKLRNGIPRAKEAVGFSRIVDAF